MALVAGTTEQTWEWHATVAPAPALPDARVTWTVADVVSGADAPACVVRLSQPVPVRMVRPRSPSVGVPTP